MKIGGFFICSQSSCALQAFLFQTFLYGFTIASVGRFLKPTKMVFHFKRLFTAIWAMGSSF
jgi:hypothetical protein